MKDYMEAYRERMMKNHDTLLFMATKLQNTGCRIFIPRGDRYISFISVYKDGVHCTFGFAEVPYRWYLSYNFKPSRERGSGRVIKEISGTENPFTTIDIMKVMEPIWLSEQDYIEHLLTYLKEY